MKHLFFATTMFEKHPLRDEEGNIVLEKNGKPKMVKSYRSIRDNGWYSLSLAYKNKQ